MCLRRCGDRGGIEVWLPENLKGFYLPTSPDAKDGAKDLRSVVEENLQFLAIAPFRITLPLFAARFRAAIAPANFALQLSGGSGAGKTALAAALLQSFGATLGAESLPVDWHSTGNSLEEVAFTLKESLLVIDDFKPGGSRFDIQRAHREADRYL